MDTLSGAAGSIILRQPGIEFGWLSLSASWFPVTPQDAEPSVKLRNCQGCSINPEERSIAMSDEPLQGELMRMDQTTGELMPADPPPATIDSIVRQETGNLSNELLASYPIESEEGQARLDRHQSFNSNPNETTAMLNMPFKLVAFTAKPVIVKKSADGTRLEVARLAVRTVMEAADGRLISSSSAWLFQSLKELLKSHGNLSEERPMHVVLRKAGLSYKLFRVRDGVVPVAPQLADSGKQAKKK